MRKLFTVGLMLVSLLLFSCSRMKDFYGIPFGSTKEEVKTYLQNEKWEIEEQEEIITATKANGKYAGKTVKEMSFSFDVGRFYSASVVFYSVYNLSSFSHNTYIIVKNSKKTRNV